MASSMYVPQFVKLLDCVDCSADEIAISSEFATRFGHRVADSVKLKFRNGYKIRVTFDRDGMSVRPDGWRFVKHLDLVHGFGDAVVLPHSFVAKFAASLPSCFKYLLNNGAEFRGNYISQEGMLEFDVSCYDGRNVELVFHTNMIRSGEVLQSIRPPLFFAVVVQPFHMLEYCHGVDISAQYKAITDWWGQREEISIFRGRRCWELEVRKRADKKRTTIHDGWIQMRTDLQLAVGDTCWFKWKDDSYHRFTVVVEKA